MTAVPRTAPFRPLRAALTALAGRRRPRRSRPVPPTPAPAPTTRRRALPLYEALAIGLGCDIATADRRARERHAR